MGSSLGGDLEKSIMESLASYDASKIKVKKEESEDDEGTLPDEMAREEVDMESSTGEKQRIGLLEKGSADAFKAVIDAGKDHQLSEQKKANTFLRDIAKEIKKDKATPAFAVQGGV
jgi:hypothetical protein